MAPLISEHAMRQQLRDLCDQHSQKRVAKMFKVSSSFVCDVLYHRRAVTEKLASAMGYERVVQFRKIR